MKTQALVPPGLVTEADAETVAYRYRSFLEPGETVIWTESGGGSGDVQALFYFALVAIGAIGFAVMYVSGVTITDVTFQIAGGGCLLLSLLANRLVRGRDDKKRDYVLTNRRLAIGNFDLDARVIFTVTDEVLSGSISRVEVRSPSPYQRIRIFVETPEGKRIIQLLDQEKPADVAQLIRSTFGLN